MPFKSKSQMRFMFAKHPRMAKKWAEHTPSISSLPQKKAVNPLKKLRAVHKKLSKGK